MDTYMKTYLYAVTCMDVVRSFTACASGGGGEGGPGGVLCLGTCFRIVQSIQMYVHVHSIVEVYKGAFLFASLLLCCFAALLLR